MHAVLAPDFAEFGLDVDPVLVTVLDDGTGGCDVVFPRQGGTVVHDTVDAKCYGLVDECDVFGVVEVDDDGDGGAAGNRQAGERHGLECPVVGGGVLADLEGDGKARPLGASNDALGVLEQDDVEGRRFPFALCVRR